MDLRPPGAPCPGDYNVPAGTHQRRLLIPVLNPDGPGPSIRDLSGERDPGAKCQEVHIHATDDIAMTNKDALRIAAAPDAPLHFLFPPAYRTLARCTPLRASEALDAGLLGLVGKIGDILPIFPLGHPLIMVASTIAVPDHRRVADKEPPKALLLAEGNHLSGALLA